MLECSYKSGSWWRLPHINLWKFLLMVSRDMSKTRPRSSWSHKISWIKLYLYDWTGFVNLGNFQIWSPFVFYFHRLSLNSLIFIFLTHIKLPPQWAYLYLNTVCVFQITNYKFCYSQINSSFWQFWAFLGLLLFRSTRGYHYRPWRHQKGIRDY